jgi:hypothetical protein
MKMNTPTSGRKTDARRAPRHVATQCKKQQSKPRCVVTAAEGRVLHTDLEESVMKTLSRSSEDDPSIILEWHEAALQALVSALSVAGAVGPAWAITPVTSASFKADLLHHAASIRVGTRPQVHTMGIAPLTLQEFSEVMGLIGVCSFEPSLVAAYRGAAAPKGPIATVYFVSDKGRPIKAQRATVALVPPNGVQVFE